MRTIRTPKFFLASLRTAVLALVGALSLVAEAAPLKTAELTTVINDVRVLDSRRGERPANEKDVVGGSDAVKTGIKSRAELLFQDNTLTRIGANSHFAFDAGTRVVELKYGTLLLQALKGFGAKVRTAAITAAVSGTTIMIEYSPAPGAVVAPRRVPGAMLAVGEMTPAEACQELKTPRRKYSRAETAELRRKCKLMRGGAGFVKVMVLEGTLRLYLNNRIGESVLIEPGQMVILSPNATTIPPSAEFDIAHLAATSLLVNNKYWGQPDSRFSLAAVESEAAEQNQQKRAGNLIDTNLVILGGGTNVTLSNRTLVAQLDRAQTANPVANDVRLGDADEAADDRRNDEPSSPAPPSPEPPPSTPTPRPNPLSDELPGFSAGGSTSSMPDGAGAGDVRVIEMLPGDVPVVPTQGRRFALFTNGGEIGAGEEAEFRTATRLSRNLSIPASSPGRRALSFDYRFLTEEIDQGLALPDRFSVTLSSGSESIVLALDRDALQPGGTGPLTPIARREVGGFAGGTDWLPFTIDLTPFIGRNVNITFLIANADDPVIDSALALDRVRINEPFPAGSLAAAIPGTLTLNLNSVNLGNGLGEFVVPNLMGRDARGGVGEGASAGTFAVNAQGGIAVNAPVIASTGLNGPAAAGAPVTGATTTFGGTGGTVQLSSAAGEIAINSTVKVSESSDLSTPRSANSRAGGTIQLRSSRASGPAISINNTGELLSLLNAAAPGPGGRIEITSAGGDIRVNGGRLVADRGLIDMRNNGPAGLVQINAANLAAETVKIGALGVDGQLTINAGSQLGAANTLRLYGGEGTAGRVLFTGDGTINLRGSPIQIGARTVQVDASTRVQNDGPTTVYTDRANFGVGSGGGNFQNSVTTTRLAERPGF